MVSSGSDGERVGAVAAGELSGVRSGVGTRVSLAVMQAESILAVRSMLNSRARLRPSTTSIRPHS
jgi:hypothetical protein